MSKFVCGDAVRFLCKDYLHEDFPQWYPEAGTIGIIVDCNDDGIYAVDWEQGSLLREDDLSVWWCGDYNLEKVEA